jgi:hypothetical protein
MPAVEYFTYGAELMKKNKPHLTDWSILQRMKRIGFEPSEDFDGGCGTGPGSRSLATASVARIASIMAWASWWPLALESQLDDGVDELFHFTSSGRVAARYRVG